jgi:hypothetical protein
VDTNIRAIELIDDAKIIADCNASARSEGTLLICHQCDDPEELIVGILVAKVAAEIQAWALCGRCLQQVSLQAWS